MMMLLSIKTFISTRGRQQSLALVPVAFSGIIVLKKNHVSFNFYIVFRQLF